MINVEQIARQLKGRYPDLESLGAGLFRGVDRFGDREYAVRYFDLNDNLEETALSLKTYQESVVSELYFSNKIASDLRWNHYLYFVVDEEKVGKTKFVRLKSEIESDREYARKLVVREDELPALLARELSATRASSMPPDLATAWSAALEKHGLGFVIDEDVSVPEAVRRIISGKKEGAVRAVSPMALLPEETAAASRFISHLEIKGFRLHPEKKEHSLGRVNLIFGTNGVGKTSLLEAIEFGYCGRNRRSSIPLGSTSVVLSLKDTSEKLSSTTDAGRLRARNSHWYAKTDLKKVSIEDSFGKFNFLDTDAAVDLSVSASSDRIGADVARLVLGAAAENLADRLRRVIDQLQDSLKELRREVSTKTEIRTAAKNRLDELESAPKHSDGMLLQLAEALKILGWVRIPEKKEQIAALREELQRAASAIELLRVSAINVLRGDERSALQVLANMNAVVIEASTLEDRVKSAKLELSKSQRRLQAANKHALAINALLPYVRANYEILVAEVDGLQEESRARAWRLTSVPEAVDLHVVEDLMEQEVEVAVVQVQREIDELCSRVSTDRLSLQALEDTQSKLTVLKQRVRAIALDIVQRSPNPDHCPVCRSEFQSGQLLDRIADNQDDELSEQAAILQSEIAAREDGLERLRKKLAIIEPLRSFIGSRSSLSSVRDVLIHVSQEKTRLENDRANLNQKVNQLLVLESSGLSIEDMFEKLEALGVDKLPTVEELSAMLSENVEQASYEQANIEGLSKVASELNREYDELAARHSIDHSEEEVLSEVVRRQVAQIEAAIGARRNLGSFMRLGADSTADEIGANISIAQDLIAKLSAAMEQEKLAGSGLESERKVIEELDAAIMKCEAGISYLATAGDVLDSLANQGSSGELAERILAENAQEIARTFAQIHLPNEFSLRVDRGRLEILRRQSGAKIELDQMSTGQRAAFALSLFLAMNGCLRSGPPVLLFDDPVAHVDDINVLSFLDHLRSLAVGGSRQIFFATADSKLAGLFRHKFRFLGDDFKEIVLCRS